MPSTFQNVIEGMLTGEPEFDQLSFFSSVLPTVDDSDGGYALAQLERLSEDHPAHQNLLLALLLGVAQARREIPRACEPKLTLVAWTQRVPLGETVDLTMALDLARSVAADRREGVVVAALDRATMRADAILRVALHLADRLPLPSLRTWAARRLTVAKKRHAKDKNTLRALAAIETALGEATERTPRANLAVRNRQAIATTDHLSVREVEQLRLAGNRWEGTARPASARLSPGDPDRSFAGTCELLRIGDAASPHLFDAWLYAGDSGAVYRAGTTDLVAERIQGHFTAAGDADPTVADALEACVGSATPRTETTSKRPAKAKSRTVPKKR